MKDTERPWKFNRGMESRLLPVWGWISPRIGTGDWTMTMRSPSSGVFQKAPEKVTESRNVQRSCLSVVCRESHPTPTALIPRAGFCQMDSKT